MDKMRIEKNWGLEMLLHFETYIGTALFLFITVILTVNVVGRFIFRHEYAWIQEVSVIAFVLMTYCGVSGAVLTRQNIKIDMVLNMVPFKVKRVMLILSTFIHAGFTAWLTFFVYRIIGNMLQTKGVYSVTRLPKVYVYIAMAFLLTLSVIRGLIEISRLAKEEEKTLGRAKPAFDLEEIWAEGDAARAEYVKTHPEAIEKMEKIRAAKAKSDGAAEAKEAKKAAKAAAKKGKEE
jgi:TRAP-type C4-dicarboxylate transport system permease small subunit